MKRVILGLVATATILMMGIMQSDAYDNQLKIRRDSVVRDVNAVDYTFIPVERVTEVFGANNFNFRDFKEFTIRNFGNYVDKEFTTVPTDAVILFQLREISNRLDKIENIKGVVD